MTGHRGVPGVRAVVLAAGRGVRMGGVHAKTLIPLGDGEPLLHYIIAGLRVAGISDLLVVTGYERNDVERFVVDAWGETGVTFVFNARYASWGNFHSLRVALDQSPGLNVLAINSDVVVHPDVFRRSAVAEGELVLAVERRRRLDAEDMRVELKGPNVRSIGKSIAMARSHGEFDGVSLIRPPAANVYLRLATDAEWRRTTSLYYEDIYQMMISEVDVRAAFVLPGEYAEVDQPGDVASAQRVIESHAGAWGEPTPQSSEAPSEVG
jgi:choline kinase